MTRWSQPKLVTRFRFFAGIFGVAMIAPALFAYSLSGDAAQEMRRAAIIEQVIQHFENLEDIGHRASAGTSLSAPEALKLRNEVSSLAGKIRLAISEEVAIVGESGAAEEAEEIRLIDAIEVDLRDVAEGRAPARWTDLVQQGIDEETRELDAISKSVRSAGTNIRVVLLAEALLAALLVAGLLNWISRQVVAPLQRLTNGAAELAAGNDQHRLVPSGDPDMLIAMQTFNHMADQLNEQRDKIEDANEVLARAVDERTAELELTNLKLGNLIARRGGFLADVSHELRTPIAIIRGETDVVLRNRQSTREDLTESLRRVSGQANTLTKLVDDLLYVARSENGAPVVRSVRTDLLSIARTAVADVCCLIEADDGAIGFQSHEKQAFILGDPSRLAQLLRILIDNAIQYSSGPPVITVGLLRSTAGYHLSVSDQGIGIAPSEISEIFERYRRGGKAADANVGGQGLGLPLAKAIVEAHGGTISIESEDGKGATVHVAFPNAAPLRAIA